MSFVLIIYLLVLMLLGYIVFFIQRRRIRHAYEKYLTIGIIFIFLWVFFYMFLFLFKFDSYIDVYRVRVLYGLGFLILYTMLAFFYFYGTYNNKKKLSHTRFNVWFSIFLFTVFSVIMGTDKIIVSMEYNPTSGESYELFGAWYIFLEILHILSLILLIGIVWYKRRILSGIYKIRYSYIAFGYFITMLFQILFLSVLPALDIWLMEREQIIFFLPFLGGILYSMYRYRFRKISFGIGRVLIFIFSATLSVFIVLALKNMFTFMDHNLLTFWNLNKSISLGDIIVGNIIFYTSHRYLQNQFKLYYDNSFFLQKQLSKIQHKIPFLQTHDRLCDFLQTQFAQKMRINHIDIIVGDDLVNVSELVSYFQHGGVYNFFLNDSVFIEENKNKFSPEKIYPQLNPDTVLYIPMYKKKGEILGILCVGKKPFGDYYSLAEIDILQGFASFLTGHLTYMNIYSKIYELNLTLDKKVDEKTIEYNNLINRQKEFIAYVGHEIRNPITNTIFLCYDLQEKINEAVQGKLLGSDLKEDIDMLSNELKKVSDLSKKIFTTEKIDLGKAQLYKSNVVLHEFLLNEISILERSNVHVLFDKYIQDVGEMSIDEIQFRQVIQNLIGNALKFIPAHKGKISITLGNIDDNIKITIEDNGKGFGDVDSADVFDKYRIGSHQSSGLGMGLYLCKKIVELHGGTIESSISRRLGGAQFIVIL